MKKLRSIAIILCLTAAALITSCPTTVKAQTSTEVSPELATTGLGKVFNFLKTNEELLSTNKTWTFIPYASHAKGLLDRNGDKAEWGGGIALMHPINDSDYFRGGFRLQSLGGEIVMPSVNAQIQSSYHVPGTKAVSTFFGFTGLATMAGGSQENGKIGMLFGLGVSVKYPISDHWDVGVAYAVEQWTNLKVGQVDHFGLIATVKF